MTGPSSNGPTSHPERDGIYRIILWVLVADVILGAVLTIAGETVLGNPVLSRVGFGMAIIGAVLYFFFRWLGAREAKRRRGPGSSQDSESS